MKCVNCENTATYNYEPSQGQVISYCVNCLPSFLKGRALAGHLEVTAESKTEVDDAIAILQEATTIVVEEEPVAEEPKVKKATKKSDSVKPDADETNS
jgi:hypothetical protein